MYNPLSINNDTDGPQDAGRQYLQPGNASARSGLLIIAAALALGFSLAFDNFGTFANANSIALASATLCIASLGTACLLISGNIDLSIGSIYALVGVVVAKVAVATDSGLMATIAGLSLGLILGLLNGYLVRLLRLSPIIVTVATMIVFSGLAYLVTKGDTVGGLPEAFVAIGRSSFGPLKTPVLIATALFLIVAFVLTRTRLGLRLYTIGGNAEAARLAGISVNRTILWTYGLNGMIVAGAAVLTTARLGIASPNAGIGLEFGVLTAVILGGIAFNGGAGRPLGIIFGIAALGILNAGLIFIGLPSYFQDILRGLLLLAALGADVYLQRKRALKVGKEAPVDRVLKETEDFARTPERRAAWSGDPNAEPVLSVKGLKKRYGAVVAVSNADLEVAAGEVVCLLGDNGAGKSTLVKMISGAVAYDAGTITVAGERVVDPTPDRMRSLGVETVYQNLALCDNLSIAHNLTLGNEPTRKVAGLIEVRDDAKAIEIADHRLKGVATNVPSPTALVSALSGGQRQAVAIARTLTDGVKVVILDEPTAALGVHQTAAVLDMIRQLSEKGVGIILISHDEQTVHSVSDRIVVLRQGRVARTLKTADVDEITLLRLMAGMLPDEADEVQKTPLGAEDTTPKSKGTHPQNSGANCNDIRMKEEYSMGEPTFSTTQAQTVTTGDGASISYRDTGGEGRPIVFLPGWACDQEMWDLVASNLPDTNRVITMDYAGFGASSSTERAWKMQNLAGDVVQVIDALDLNDVLLVGHSMGGGVALEAARLAPRRVAKVVGADSFTYAAFYPRMAADAIKETIASLRPDFDGAVRGMMSVYFLEGSDPAIKEGVSDIMAGANPDRALETMADFLHWDVDEAIDACPVPVAAINSAALLDQGGFDHLSEEIDIRLIDGVGHFLMMEKPEDFAAALTEIA